jgi:hypothetical protein
MFFDANRNFQNFDLLDHVRSLLGVFESSPTTGAVLQGIREGSVKLLRWKRGAFMLRMAWLASNASSLRFLLGRLRRFHKIAGWRFGRGGRILAGLRQFAFELFNTLMETLIFLYECLDNVFKFMLSHVGQMYAT